MKISDYKLTKEHPHCRKAIIAEAFRPAVYEYSGKRVWDGYSCFDRNGQCGMTGGSLCKQLRLMAKQGYWGDLSNVIVDQDLWFKADDFARMYLIPSSDLLKSGRRKRGGHFSA